jgi:hypothetical protein
MPDAYLTLLRKAIRMSNIGTSPYQNQEETSPIIIKRPSIEEENCLTAFKMGRRSAENTLADLTDAGAFGKDNLGGSLLAMAYGVDMLALCEAVHNSSPIFKDFFRGAMEMAVNAGDISSDGGRLFLNLFGAEAVE